MNNTVNILGLFFVVLLIFSIMFIIDSKTNYLLEQNQMQDNKINQFENIISNQTKTIQDLNNRLAVIEENDYYQDVIWNWLVSIHSEEYKELTGVDWND